MKGCLKNKRPQGHKVQHNKTNFNDWSDPKCKPLKCHTEHKMLAGDELSKVEEVGDKGASITSQTSLEIELVRKKIKAGLPLLTQKEIRTFKLPFHESLLLNLKEDGFSGTFFFISDLINLDDRLHTHSNDPGVRNRQPLKLDVDKLHALCQELMKAELAKRDGNANQELRVFLYMALFISTWGESMNWLAEELFEQCIGIESDSETIDLRLIAVAKHLYSIFLLEKLDDLKRAKMYAEESMELSVGKIWRANDITGKDEDILYFESCLLLHKIFLYMASDQAAAPDLETAILLCKSSLRWAKEINCRDAETKALMQLVVLYMAAGQLTHVLGHLEQYMKLCSELEDIQGLCEGYIIMSDYHKLAGEDNLVIDDIKNLLKTADQNNITKMMAVAHRKLATFYLVQAKDKEMKEHAVKAYSCYRELNSELEIEETRCLTGIAQAQDIMSQFLYIVTEADDVEFIEFKILMMWKSLRIPFSSSPQLFQPEAEVNTDLKARINSIRNEEMIMANNARRAEMQANSSIIPTRIGVPKLTSPSAVPLRISKSINVFHQQLKSAIKGGSLASFSPSIH